jgi:unsaturated rhamnogalacturonyl hydrolase
MDPGFETRSGNYIESSGSAMFVYGLFKSLRHGYIAGEKYEAVATSGYELMTSAFAQPKESDGSLGWKWTVQTGSLSSNGTFEACLSILNF